MCAKPIQIENLRRHCAADADALKSYATPADKLCGVVRGVNPLYLC
jgi:hypothetical protein